MTDGPGLQRELKLDMSNPVANVYLTAINAALDEAAERVPEAQLRDLVPKWFLRALVAEGVYGRTKEPHPNGRGREQWVWRKKDSVD